MSRDIRYEPVNFVTSGMGTPISKKSQNEKFLQPSNAKIMTHELAAIQQTDWVFSLKHNNIPEIFLGRFC